MTSRIPGGDGGGCDGGGGGIEGGDGGRNGGGRGGNIGLCTATRSESSPVPSALLTDSVTLSVDKTPLSNSLASSPPPGAVTDNTALADTKLRLLTFTPVVSKTGGTVSCSVRFTSVERSERVNLTDNEEGGATPSDRRVVPLADCISDTMRQVGYANMQDCSRESTLALGVDDVKLTSHVCVMVTAELEPSATSVKFPMD